MNPNAVLRPPLQAKPHKTEVAQTPAPKLREETAPIERQQKGKPHEPEIALFQEARKKATVCAFQFHSGRKMTGTLERFGTYSLIVRSNGGLKILYKHAIELIELEPETGGGGVL